MQFYFCEMKDYEQHEWNYNKFGVIIKLTPSVSLGFSSKKEERFMKYRSVFDIIGPVMIGPSSSHTAGAARIGRVARHLFDREPKWAHISFYGSFAKTYKGHGTDVAIVGGLLDFDTFDERIKESLEIARKKKMKITFREEEAVPEHPNTAKITVGDDDGELELVGISIGGGKLKLSN